MSKEGISCMYLPVHVMCITATQCSPISDNSACHGVSADISSKASPLLKLTLVGHLSKSQEITIVSFLQGISLT